MKKRKVSASIQAVEDDGQSVTITIRQDFSLAGTIAIQVAVALFFLLSAVIGLIAKGGVIVAALNLLASLFMAAGAVMSILRSIDARQVVSADGKHIRVKEMVMGLGRTRKYPVDRITDLVLGSSPLAGDGQGSLILWFTFKKRHVWLGMGLGEDDLARIAQAIERKTSLRLVNSNVPNAPLSQAAPAGSPPGGPAGSLPSSPPPLAGQPAAELEGPRSFEIAGPLKGKAAVADNGDELTIVFTNGDTRSVQAGLLFFFLILLLPGGLAVSEGVNMLFHHELIVPRMIAGLMIMACGVLFVVAPFYGYLWFKSAKQTVKVTRSEITLRTGVFCLARTRAIPVSEVQAVYLSPWGGTQTVGSSGPLSLVHAGGNVRFGAVISTDQARELLPLITARACLNGRAGG